MPGQDNSARRSPYYGYGGQINRYGDQPQRGDRVEVQGTRRTDSAPVHSGYVSEGDENVSLH